MHIRSFRILSKIEKKINKIRINVEYLYGDYFLCKEKQFVTTIIRINKYLYKFNHYIQDDNGKLRKMII